MGIANTNSNVDSRTSQVVLNAPEKYHKREKNHPSKVQSHRDIQMGSVGELMAPLLPSNHCHYFNLETSI